MEATFEINDRLIGPDNSTYMIAEMSANHCQDYEIAVETVRAAGKAGADAVKVQTFKPETMTIDSDKSPFRIEQGTQWDGKTLYELYEEAYMPWEWHEDLKEEAHSHDMDFFSTAYDETALEFLRDLDIPVYKIASFENTDIPLIREVARTGKPLIVSTGMASLGEIERLVNAVKEEGNDQLALLRCVSNYPANPQNMNLKTIPHLRRTFGTVVGLSDHTLGHEVAVASVSLGASIIEKHFTLDRNLDSPDSHFSLEPDEFEKMVESIRIVEQAIGNVNYSNSPSEKENTTFRRSIFAVTDINKGETLTPDNIRRIRPSHGIAPQYYEQIMGNTVTEFIEEGTPLNWDHFN